MIKFANYRCSPYFEFNQEMHDIFLPKHLCQNIPEELIEPALSLLEYRNPKMDFDSYKSKMIPNMEFIQWMDACGIDFLVHAVWSDGCSLVVLRKDDAVQVKLSWKDRGAGV